MEKRTRNGLIAVFAGVIIVIMVVILLVPVLKLYREEKEETWRQVETTQKSGEGNSNIGAQSVGIEGEGIESQEIDSGEESKIKGTEQQKEDSLRIVMVGDMLMHTKVVESGKTEDGTYNFDHLFENVKDTIEEADLALVNQETILGGAELGYSGYPCFNTPTELGDAEVKAGFDVILHATNHTLDKKKAGVENCMEFWDTNYPDITYLGINKTQQEQDEDIYVYEQNGIKVAILNYTYGTNGIKTPSNMPFLVNYLDEDKIREDVKKAENIADFTIVCPHWGTEYVLKQTKEQERWAKIFFDNGVDLVIGTHPHVIEPVEMMYDVTTGHKMLVYYSLGNFVNWSGESRDGVANRFLGGMAKVTISLDEGGNPMIADYGVIATVTHVEKKTNGVYTTRLSEYTQELSLTSEVIKQDDVFSKEYLEGVADKVWGDLWE